MIRRWLRRMFRLETVDKEAREVREDAERRLACSHERRSEVEQAASILESWIQRGLTSQARL